MSNSPDYKALYLKAEKDRKREEGLRAEAEKRWEQEKALREQAEEREKERGQKTTFIEFIRNCHNLLSLPFTVAPASHSTQGDIPPPTGKYCPTKLVPWTDCPATLQEIYNSVWSYLQPTGRPAPRLFPSLSEIEALGRRFSERQISSEQDLESYERFAVEDHVRYVILELCKIPEARTEFQLGDGIQFENHINMLDEVDFGGQGASQPRSQLARPDQYCIHRLNGSSGSLITTIEYKPPHKLSVENLRAGLRPMNFWEEVISSETIPTDKEGKLVYNATKLSTSAVAQQFHTQILDGIPISGLTTGLARVPLYIPANDPSTLAYWIYEPNLDVHGDNNSEFQQPKTHVAIMVCLCLLGCRSPQRSQEWRNSARAQLHTWKTSFSDIYSQIPEDELRQIPPGSDYIGFEQTSSEYLPSSPLESPITEGRQIPTRSQAGCAPEDMKSNYYIESSDESDASQAGRGKKRRFSKVTPSSPTRQRQTRESDRSNQAGRYQHSAPFCTQKCLLGLKRNGLLDNNCPNVEQHRRSCLDRRHPITAEDLVQELKRQLDKNLDDNCTPFGECGASGAPFKVTSSLYGYTVIGKGTTSQRWGQVSREAEVYKILQRAQGSAVPVFIGKINLAKVYYLHGAGDIRHMLLMAWAGESIEMLKPSAKLDDEVQRSISAIHSLGVVHGDLGGKNILWSAEMGRIMIIDFHRSTLKTQGVKRRLRGADRPSKRTRFAQVISHMTTHSKA